MCLPRGDFPGGFPVPSSRPPPPPLVFEFQSEIRTYSVLSFESPPGSSIHPASHPMLDVKPPFSILLEYSLACRLRTSSHNSHNNAVDGAAVVVVGSRGLVNGFRHFVQYELHSMNAWIYLQYIFHPPPPTECWPREVASEIYKLPAMDLFIFGQETEDGRRIDIGG